MKVSVIICTHNRVKMLEVALKSLLQQDFDHAQYEIIVVDNASEDNTRDLVTSYADIKPTYCIRYLYERHLGISWARNAGWQAAQGNYIAFIDDDERAEPDWLRLLALALDDRPLPVVAVGGPVMLDWSGSRPDWLPPSMDRFYSRVDLGNEAVILDKGHYPLTSNLVIRREVMDSMGGFRTDLGHVGNILIGGEDVEFIDRVRSLGMQIVYEPKAIVRHHIPKTRQTPSWLLRRCYYGGMSTPVLDDMRVVRVRDVAYSLRQATIFIARAIWHMMMKRQKQAAVENACISMINLGRAEGLIRMALRGKTNGKNNV